MLLNKLIVSLHSGIKSENINLSRATSHDFNKTVTFGLQQKGNSQVASFKETDEVTLLRNFVRYFL